MTYLSDHSTSCSELIDKIERQCQIICDLLTKNEQLRNQLSRMEHLFLSNPSRLGEIDPWGDSSCGRGACTGKQQALHPFLRRLFRAFPESKSGEHPTQIRRKIFSSAPTLNLGPRT
jgi:hypothetical protein